MEAHEVLQMLKEEQEQKLQYPKITTRPLGSEDNHFEALKIFAGNNWEFTPEITNLYKLLINYFHGIESDKYNLSKGIMIVGSYGSGKTSLFEQFRIYLRKFGNPNCFSIVPCRLILREFTKKGFEGLEKYSYNHELNAHDIPYSNPNNLCIDDLGTEEGKGINYGQKVDCISELMQDRYELSKSNNIFTHATSNLSPSQMKDIYSERIIDRFVEMFNIFVLTGKSHRI